MDLSIVVPVFNEQDSIRPFLEATFSECDALAISTEFVFVNDGSSDNTLSVLQDAIAEYPNIRLINLARNFGKELALTAGIDNAQGDAVIPMDVDLQDPPSLIPLMVAKHQEGYDVVLAVRNKRDGDSWAKKFFAHWFYRIFQRISDIEILENAGDFRLVSRRVVNVIKAMPERNRFMKGLLSWPGYPTTTVFYDRPHRHTGETKWGFKGLLRLAFDGLFSFSTLPLKVWTYLGLTMSLISLLYMAFTIFKTVIMGIDVPGYASLLVVSLFIGGINLMGIGIIGEYIGRIFIEVKGRPLYVVESIQSNDGIERL